ncbi:MAG TPA: peptidylprolyl isomerase [Candidatus Binataceae bacterium]|nr:peptidylprolyl isomerase [Candidatus Binataceae bacterium]
MRISLSAIVMRAGALAAAAVIAVCATPMRVAAQPPVDRVVASVDGDPITAHDVQAFSVAVGNPVSTDDIANNANAKLMLKELIAAKLFQSEAQKYSAKINDVQVDHYIEQIRHDRHMTPDQFKAAIRQSGLSMQDFRKHARQELEKAMMIQQEVRDRVDISDADIRAYYGQHQADYTVAKERYRLAQILIGVPSGASPQQIEQLRRKADQIRTEAANGADFGALAHKYSDDVSKNDAGELGWFAPMEINDQILGGIKPVEPGNVSQVIRTNHGFHILKVEAHETPGVRPLADVKDDIRERLVDAKAKSETQQWVETELVKKHDVETLY